MQIRLQGTKVRKQIQITTFATFFLPDFRTFGGSLGRSTVAHFARKVRGANIAAAKHELKIQQSHAQKRWSCSLRVRGPHFASKVSYNAGAATDDYAGQRKSPCEGVGASLPTLNHLDFERPIYFLPCLGAIFELILSHNARIAPSNKLKNSSIIQVQNCPTYSFTITKKKRGRPPTG